MILKRKLVGCLTLVFLFAATTPGWAQVGRGSISGTVSDASGAVIPGVAITVIHTDTNQTRELITNEAGNYEVPLLQIGQYRITAELPGFRTAVRDGVRLSVGDRVRVDIELVVGQLAETVQVTAEAPLIRTEDAAMSATIDHEKLVNLPLNGRNFIQLAYLIPGSFAPRQNSHLGHRGGITVGGVSEKTNQTLLDGINNQGAGTHEMSTPLILDAIAEFKILTNTYGAQYGTFAGGQLDAVSKGGSNEFHGGAFWFHRNDNLDARNFFDPWPLERLPEFRRHQFGATFGGPIIENKMFFFYAFEGQRQIKNNTARGSMPREEFWDGDFSGLSKQLVDPVTGDPFPGNIIPKDRLNSRSLKFKEFYDPHYPLTLPGVSQNAINSAIDETDHRKQHAFRWDYQLNSDHSVMVSYNNYRSTFVEWAQAGRPFLAEHRSHNSKQLAFHTAVSYTWVVSPTIVNDFRVGANRLIRRRSPIAFGDRWFNDEIGVYGTLADKFPFHRGIPDVRIRSYENLGSSGTQWNMNHAYTAINTMSINKGDHNVKLGFQYYKHGQNTYFGSNRRGRFDFNGDFSGDGFADFLLGYLDSSQRTTPGPANTELFGPCYLVEPERAGNACGIDFHPWITSYSAFFQDDWKFSPRLTLNLGLRYDYNTPLREKYGRMKTYVIETNTVRPGLKDDPLHRKDFNNFAPRIGLAYLLTDEGSTVLRAGFGVFYGVDDVCNCGIYTRNPPNSFNTFFDSGNFTSDNPLTMDNPFPVSPEEQFQTRAGLSPEGMDPDFRTFYYQNWNLSLQHELAGQLVVEATYEGKVGHGLDKAVNINQAVQGSGSLQPRRPIQPWSNIIMQKNTGNSNYHAGLLKVEKRMSDGISFLSSYAWSKMIDDGLNDSARSGGRAQNEARIDLERGLSGYDTRHRLSISSIVQLPFGQGRRFRSDSAILNSMFGGWEVATIMLARTGLRLTPRISGDWSGTGQRTDRPDLIGDPNNGPKSPEEWFNTDAFALQPRGQFGTAGRGIIEGPGSTNFDLSLIKRINFDETKRMELRFEFFNAFNTPTFWLPNTTANSSSFGKISQAQDARQIQVGMKLNF